MRRLGFIFLWLVGCGGEVTGDVTPPDEYGAVRTARSAPGPDTLVGDWFLCQDPECRGISDEGFSFTVDGHAFVLDARGSSLEPDESYCVTDDYGTYRLLLSGHGDLLELTLANTVRRRRGTREYWQLEWVEYGRHMNVTAFDGPNYKSPFTRISPSRLVSECEGEIN